MSQVIVVAWAAGVPSNTPSVVASPMNRRIAKSPYSCNADSQVARALARLNTRAQQHLSHLPGRDLATYLAPNNSWCKLWIDQAKRATENPAIGAINPR